jgi:hypothetical protein
METRFLLFAIASFALMVGAPLAATQSALMAACKTDAAKLCPDVPFGGGKIIECLKTHESEITVGCANELKLVKP